MEASFIPAIKGKKPYLHLLLSNRNDFIRLYPGMYLTGGDIPVELRAHLVGDVLQFTLDPSIELCREMGFK